MNYSWDYQQQTYDPSSHQIQAYEQSAANYYSYSYHHYNSNIPQPYPCYNLTVQPKQHEEQQEPKPPGVSEPLQQAQNSYHQYYQHAAVVNVGPEQGGVNAGVSALVPAQQLIFQPAYGGTGGMDGRPPQGGAHSHSRLKPNVLRLPFRGRGRGRGRALHLPPKHASAPAQAQRMFVQEAAHIQGELPQPLPPYASSFGSVPMPCQGQVHAAPVLPPPKAAWCELCRVDCNTLEILEKHQNGKKHKKNLKVYEEIQKLNKSMTGGRMEQTSASLLRSEVSLQPDQIEGYGEIKFQPESLPSQAVNEEREAAVEKRKVEEVVEPTQELAKKMRMDRSVGRGRKHKMRGGKGGRIMRSCDGSRRAPEPPKPKVVIPLICELCNVKCDTSAVFQCHLMGKKHLSKAKCFLSHQEILGQEVLKALSPAILALLQNAANASTSTGPQLHHQSFVPFQGVVASAALDAKTMNFHDSAPGINAGSAKVEAVSHPLQFSANSGAGYVLNTEGKLNEGHSEFGAENNHPAAVSSAVPQTEHVAACTAIATSGIALNVSSVFEHSAVVPPSDQTPHPGPDSTVGEEKDSTH